MKWNGELVELLCHLQRKTFSWSRSWKENDKKCSTRSDITSSVFRKLSNRHTQAHYEQTHYEQTRAIVRQLVTLVFVHRQYEQLTQMKLAFETRMQRQHDLSEVRSCTRDVLRGSDCKQQMFNVNKVLDCIKHF